MSAKEHWLIDCDFLLGECIIYGVYVILLCNPLLYFMKMAIGGMRQYTKESNTLTMICLQNNHFTLPPRHS